MTPKSIFNAIQHGNTVTYTVIVLRGYLHGTRSLVFTPSMRKLNTDDISRRLKNFRQDEAPYCCPVWVVSDDRGKILRTTGSGEMRASVHRRVKT